MVKYPFILSSMDKSIKQKKAQSFRRRTGRIYWFVKIHFASLCLSLSSYASFPCPLSPVETEACPCAWARRYQWSEHSAHCSRQSVFSDYSMLPLMHRLPRAPLQITERKDLFHRVKLDSNPESLNLTYIILRSWLFLKNVELWRYLCLWPVAEDSLHRVLLDSV